MAPHLIWLNFCFLVENANSFNWDVWRRTIHCSRTWSRRRLHNVRCGCLLLFFHVSTRQVKLPCKTCRLCVCVSDCSAVILSNRPDFFGFPSWAGAAHSAEFSFVWGDVINDDTESEEVKDLSRRIIQYWSNFAKTGWECHCWYITGNFRYHILMRFADFKHGQHGND